VDSQSKAYSLNLKNFNIHFDQTVFI